jgi:hypothetical protein
MRPDLFNSALRPLTKHELFILGELARDPDTYARNAGAGMFLLRFKAKGYVSVDVVTGAVAITRAGHAALDHAQNAGVI